MVRLLAALVCLTAFASITVAAPAPSTCVPAAGTQPATSPSVSTAATSPSPAVIDLLDRIQQRAKAIKTIHAKVRYDRVQGLLGDTQRRWGTLVYEAGPAGGGAKFAVHFDKLAVDEAARPQNRWYIYDGHWLAEKYGDQRIFIRHELEPAKAVEGSQTNKASGGTSGDGGDEDGAEGGSGGGGGGHDLLSLGEGPFVLPLDARKDEVLKKFIVRLLPLAKDQPEALEGTVHLELTPKKNSGIQLTRIDLWYDVKTLLPRRATTHDQSQNVSVITLSDIVLNKAVAKGTFDTTPPRGGGWEVRIKGYEGK